jgi:hypothetical protein
MLTKEMRPNRTAWVVLLLVLASWASAQSRQELGSPFLDFRLVPGIAIPLAGDRELFEPGPVVLACASFKLPGVPLVYACAEAGYGWLPVPAESSLSLVTAGGGAAVRLSPLARLQLGASLTGGIASAILHRGTLVGQVQHGESAYLRFSGQVAAFLTPSLSMGIEAGYTLVSGLAQLAGVALGAAYHLQAPGSGPVSVETVLVSKLFPIEYRRYAEGAPGIIILRNNGRFPAKDVQASIFVPEYMGQPTTWRAASSLPPGEIVEIEPRLLFNDRILGLIEATSLAAELRIEYEYAGRRRNRTAGFELETWNRNALTWEDDRKAALFVSARDPVVLELAGRSAAAVRGAGWQPLNSSFRLAAGVHAALVAGGLCYAVDPQSPYTAVRKDGWTPDFLKFPRQTLKQGAGDCDDLTVLYCALLESIGVETAFITVPGHILPAVCLGLAPEEAGLQFTHVEDLILRDGKTWLPVEITEVAGGFLKAWQEGARCWREHAAAGRASLYPLRECWRTYAPVSLREGEIGISYPEPERVRVLYQKEMAGIVDRELTPKVAELRGVIKSGGAAGRVVNSLGVLYARYGLYDQAEEQFEAVLSREEYLPALVNLGNLCLIREEFAQALARFRRAQEIAPENGRILLGLARACYGLERYDEVKEHYARLKAIDAELAGRFAYLVVRRKEEERSFATSGLDPQVLWEEE